MSGEVGGREERPSFHPTNGQLLSTKVFPLFICRLFPPGRELSVHFCITHFGFLGFNYADYYDNYYCWDQHLILTLCVELLLFSVSLYSNFYICNNTSLEMLGCLENLGTLARLAFPQSEGWAKGRASLTKFNDFYF